MCPNKSFKVKIRELRGEWMVNGEKETTNDISFFFHKSEIVITRTEAIVCTNNVLVMFFEK